MGRALQIEVFAKDLHWKSSFAFEYYKAVAIFIGTAE